MSWENSIFNDDRSPLESWQNRDEDTHMHVRDDLNMTMAELSPYQEPTGWEKDLVEAAFHKENFSENN